MEIAKSPILIATITLSIPRKKGDAYMLSCYLNRQHTMAQTTLPILFKVKLRPKIAKAEIWGGSDGFRFFGII